MKKVELDRWRRYFEARDSGLSIEPAARKSGISPASAYRFERGDQSSSGLEAASLLGVRFVGGEPVDLPLSEEAQRALRDFAYFRRRYFGRVSTPWQEDAAYEVLRAIQSPDREWIVMNEPPGSGKSTLFTHDIPCWLIAQDRATRGQIGSRTERQARMYVGRIKKSLEREAPMRAPADALIAGTAFDAEATLLGDFGIFRPPGRGDVWRQDSLTVRQLDGTSLDDKEPTVSAWGQDSGFLGGRFVWVVWDDLVDRKNTKTQEAREDTRLWFDSEAESRVEPGGAFLLQGQRIANNDLYKYALEKSGPDGTPKYRHVKYKAHFEELCTGNHDEVAPYPKGCLLDPYRLPWSLLEQKKHESLRTFSLIYQQEDGKDGTGLVDPAWIDGGIDFEGYLSVGCKDRDRSVGQFPEHLKDQWETWSFVTVDPSPTEYWAIMWWLYDGITGTLHLVDMWRRQMNPEQFLTFERRDQEFSGLLVDLHHTSSDLGIPIGDVIFEINAAQRWFNSNAITRDWEDVSGMRILPHTTHINKKDPKFGFESVGDWFRQGLIRLPDGDIGSKMRVSPLISEAVNFPDSDTDDTLMATWFAKLAIENLYTPRKGNMYRLSVPKALAGARRGMR